MSATNDGYIERFALPGVPDPLLPNDIVNKNYVDSIFVPTLRAVLTSDKSITNTTTLSPTNLKLQTLFKGKYAFQLFAQLAGTNTTAGFKCNFQMPATTYARWQFTEKNSQPATINDGNVGTTTVATGNNGRVEISGVVENTLFTPAYFIWAVAQNVADPSTLQIRTNSWLILTKLD